MRSQRSSSNIFPTMTNRISDGPPFRELGSELAHLLGEVRSSAASPGQLRFHEGYVHRILIRLAVEGVVDLLRDDDGDRVLTLSRVRADVRCGKDVLQLQQPVASRRLLFEHIDARGEDLADFQARRRDRSR